MQIKIDFDPGVTFHKQQQQQQITRQKRKGCFLSSFR